MWKVNAYTLLMTEGDFGVELPITISGTTLAASDSVKLTIKKSVDGDVVLDKTFTNISNNTFNLVLTEAETALLPVGTYVYVLDWYQSGTFMCNIIERADFKVVNKA